MNTLSKFKRNTEFVPCPETDSVGEEQKLICFVCTGNTCRSPMAAAVLNALGGGRFRAISAGTAAAEGEPISENAVLALRSAGIGCTAENDYESHRARRISRNIVLHSDRIIAISARHALELIGAFPEAAHKISAFPSDIADPFLGGKQIYELCLEQIIEGIKELFGL